MAKRPNTVKAIYEELRSCLKQSPNPETADLDARLILEKRAQLSYIDILTAGDDKTVDDSVYSKISSDLERRLKGEPLSKIYQVNEFWGREFIVTEDVLDPRADTESIIEAALSCYQRRENTADTYRIADIGTGTGCIAITLLCEMEGAEGVATDISEKALAVARHNAENHKLAERLTFKEGDLLEPLGDDAFDLIVTNPPYIPSKDIENLSESVKNYDPILALDGGEDGLNPYKKIFISLKKNLRTNGVLILECGYDQIEAITRIGENAGATLERIIYDLSGHARGGIFRCGDK